MGKRTNTKMKNILITLILFAITVNSQTLPDNHNGTFTYFVTWDSDEIQIEEVFYSEKEAIDYVNRFKYSHDYRILITPNIY